jgi:hypothetical protein
MSDEDLMKHIILFATQADLLGVMADVEARYELQYVKVGDHESAEPTVYPRAADVPSLGIAKHGWVMKEDDWYLLDRATQVVVDVTQRPGRKPRYFVGARLNPHAVILIPGGRLDDRGIVQGNFNPVSPSKEAVSLFTALKRAFQRAFTMAHGGMVGPEALVLYRRGMRLAYSLHSPPESDFKMEQDQANDPTT